MQSLIEQLSYTSNIKMRGLPTIVMSVGYRLNPNDPRNNTDDLEKGSP